MSPEPLRVLVFPEVGRNWTARALEHDIAVQGCTLEGAVDALVKVVRAHFAFDARHNRAPLSGFPPAPRLYWNVFREATRLSPVRQLDDRGDGTPVIIVANTDHHPAAYRRLSLSLTA
jgi:hypothetical protein